LNDLDEDNLIPDLDLKNESVNLIDSEPEILIIAIAPDPGGVEGAIIVPLDNIIFIDFY
tara:strand:+ start:88 stop:264 length:177 start_codon:yes stop_codon:yes gene_type:complete